MKKSIRRVVVNVLGLLTTIFIASACSDPATDPAPIGTDNVGSCKAACQAHAPPTCNSECQSACDGRCTGSMSNNNFPEVDSIDCNESGVTFHEGASELTCYP